MTLIHQLQRTVTTHGFGSGGKSIQQPIQQITYLEHSFFSNMVWSTVFDLCGVISTMVTDSFIPANTFLRVPGLMTTCIDLVSFAILQMRPIQFYLLSLWCPHLDNLDQQLPHSTSTLLDKAAERPYWDI